MLARQEPSWQLETARMRSNKHPRAGNLSGIQRPQKSRPRPRTNITEEAKLNYDDDDDDDDGRIGAVEIAQPTVMEIAARDLDQVWMLYR